MPSSDTMPLVAIVTPVYNGATFLAEAMASVQALDYPNLIHIVLDNASTDATADIVRSFANGRVPLRTARNVSVLPIAANWNAAIRMIPSAATYFHLLCADDSFRPHAITRSVALAEQDSKIGWVGCLRRAEGRLCGEGIPKDVEVFDGHTLLRSFFRREHSGFAGMFALIRCSKIDPDQDFYDPALVCAFDTNANLRIALGGKVGFIQEELVFWREHGAQVTAQVQRGRHILFDWFILLDRYGPYVLGHRDYECCRKAYRNHYLRRMLLVRFKEKDREVFDWHMQSLRARDDPATPASFAVALFDWVMKASKGKRDSVGTPERPAFGAPVIYPKIGSQLAPNLTETPACRV